MGVLYLIVNTGKQCVLDGHNALSVGLRVYISARRIEQLCNGVPSIDGNDFVSDRVIWRVERYGETDIGELRESI